MKRFLQLILLVICCGQLWAAELYVRTGDYSSIQAAIDDANDGDMVIVDPYTYYENINFLGKAITVTSLDPNDPCIVADTIIDGSLPADANKGSVVTFNCGEGNDSILTGFTITGGTGSWLQIYWEFKGYLWNRCGGGILCYNSSSPTIAKNFITNNIAGQGGGIYFYDHSHPFIIENTFTENTALIEHGFEDPDPCDPNIYDHGDGGAIVGFHYCNAQILNNRIESNHAYLYGGGIHVRQWSNGLIKNNDIIGNDSKLGGGIHITYTSSPLIQDNIIEFNIGTSLGGGGIYVFYYSDPIIERNLITQNDSPFGAGIGIYTWSEPIIRNNLIIKNKNSSGILCKNYSAPIIRNNTITANITKINGGGIFCHATTSPVIENNIISSNSAGYGIYALPDSMPIIRYNDIWDNEFNNYGGELQDQRGINGNISVDPSFKGSDINDYRLEINSPCINAGDPNYKNDSITDYYGQSRVLGQFVDIGTHEAWPIQNLTSSQGFGYIQEAIDHASHLDMIVVTKGRYYENIKFNGKNVELRCLEPNDWTTISSTIIDGNGLDTVVTFESGEDSNCTLRGFTLTNGNSSDDFGGGVKIRNYSGPTISHNIIINNVAEKGAGISMDHSFSKVVNNRILGNVTTDLGEAGGMMIIDCLEDSNALIANNVIAGNKSYYAGGIRIQNSTAKIVNNTIVHNRADGEGIGVYAEADTITNCIVWGNENIATWGTGSPLYQCSANYSCIDANVSGHDNIILDPNFANPGYWNDASTPGNFDDDFFVFRNYHLLPGSPCANAGDNNSVPLGTLSDIDGEQRIFNDIVDMGADELVINPYDLNTDGLVDSYELWILSEEWLTSGTELQTDFYDDDYIDFLDFALLAEQWLWKASWRE